MRKKLLSIILILLFSFPAYGCNSGNSGKISIVSTIFPLYDFSRAVAGGNAALTLLIKPGAEVHSYDPSVADIAKIQNSDIFIYVGGESDVWAENILKSINTESVKILRLMDYVEPLEEEITGEMENKDGEDNDGEAEYDEHIWTSPANAIIIVNTILDTLCGLDPVNTEEYEVNAASYTENINTLDTAFRELTVNADRNTFLVADRFPFRYFANHYKLKYYAALPGCSNASDVSAATISVLIEKVKNESIPCVYYIELSSKKIANTIRGETGCETALLHSCQNVTAAEFKSGATYVSLMQSNIASLEKGLKTQ